MRDGKGRAAEEHEEAEEQVGGEALEHVVGLVAQVLAEHEVREEHAGREVGEARGARAVAEEVAERAEDDGRGEADREDGRGAEDVVRGAHGEAARRHRDGRGDVGGVRDREQQRARERGREEPWTEVEGEAEEQGTPRRAERSREPAALGTCRRASRGAFYGQACEATRTSSRFQELKEEKPNSPMSKPKRTRIAAFL